MKKTHKIIGIGTAEEFFKRSRARAKKIDRGEKIQPEMRLMFEDPADLIRAVTTERRIVTVSLAVLLLPGMAAARQDGPADRGVGDRQIPTGRHPHQDEADDRDGGQ